MSNPSWLHSVQCHHAGGEAQYANDLARASPSLGPEALPPTTATELMVRPKAPGVDMCGPASLLFVQGKWGLSSTLSGLVRSKGEAPQGLLSLPSPRTHAPGASRLVVVEK